MERGSSRVTVVRLFVVFTSLALCVVCCIVMSDKVLDIV